MIPRWRPHGVPVLVAFSVAVCGLVGNAQDSPVVEDGWVQQKDQNTGFTVHTKTLTVHPKAAPKPALKHRILKDSFEVVEGNAAIHFLMATGFFDKEKARNLNAKFIDESFVKAKREGIDVDTLPPWIWLKTAPGELPLNEVKAYLKPLSFQLPMMREVALRDHFDLDRGFRRMDDPIGFPLPEVQISRDLARAQSLRCRVAIAEGRTGDAIEIIGQQIAMARHLSQDDFLVSDIIGMGFVITAWNDMCYLVQHPETPNLYWALAAMPTPLVDLQHSLSLERQFLIRQLPVLAEVTETPRDEDYWQEFIQRLLPQLGTLASQMNLPAYDEDPKAALVALIERINEGYSGAKDYLINEQEIPREQVEGYPRAQVVFLAMIRYHEHWRDEYHKWTHPPYWQVHAEVNASDLDQAKTASSQQYGWCTLATQALLPNVFAARVGQAHVDQIIALMQTVEALRMYAASQDGNLPKTLGDLEVPAPIDPFTGRPVQYQLDGEQATITGHDLPGLRYRFVLRVAQ